MKYVEALAWLECTSLGCDIGRAIDSRHLDNLTDSGGWHCCLQHEGEVPC